MGSEGKKMLAMIGAGMVAKTHVAACVASDAVSLKGILSRTPSKARGLAESAGEAAVYGSVAEIADDESIDFAIIATPPNVRRELVEPLANAGKHILLEKPVGRTFEEAREITDLCKAAGVHLGIVFQHRVRQASSRAAALVAESELGALALVEISVPWWRDQAYYDEAGRGTYERDGGGVLISQAIHTIDLALSLTGPVRSVSAMAKTTGLHRMEAEDFVVAGLEFQSGAVGSMVTSTASYPGGAESIVLHFECATLHLEAGQLRLLRRDGTQETFGEETGTGGGADPMAFTHEWHQGIIENFAACLDGREKLVSSGEDALVAHQLIDAAIRSAKSASKVELSP